MSLDGHKVAVLLESDYYEPEIFYYQRRFAEEGADLHFLTRLWGQPFLTFLGHEFRAPLQVHESFEELDDGALAQFSALIVPSGMVADRLRYSDAPAKQLAPATEFLKRAFAMPQLLKGIICHGLWLVAAAPELVRGRPVTAHNNLYGDVLNMGALYRDEDVVVDGDLVTGRSGAHCHLFAREMISLLNERVAAA